MHHMYRLISVAQICPVARMMLHTVDGLEWQSHKMVEAVAVW